MRNPNKMETRSSRKRLDQYLFDKKLVSSRQKAQEIIKEKKVCLKFATREVWPDKPSYCLSDQEFMSLESGELEILLEDSQALRFVSRGGLKLEGAINRLHLNLRSLTVLDVGQSTGGFTDCLLKAGAKFVVGVDSGHSQLHPDFINHPQVESFEKFKIHVHSNQLIEKYLDRFDLIVVDVSFISLEMVLPHLINLLKPKGQILSLVKPQFEVGKKGLNKKGIVKSELDLMKVEVRIKDFCKKSGFHVVDYFESDILGADGNKEYFVYAKISSPS